MKDHQQDKDTFLLLELEEVQEKVATPERVLFLSVLLQALLDATKPETSVEPEEEKLARKSAQAWFFASIGVTAKDFEEVCDLAGIEPVRMRTFAFKVLKSKEIKYVRRRINTVLSYK